MLEQEKLAILTAGFGKLDDRQKDYIQALLRKLVDIHCDGGYKEIIFIKNISKDQKKYH